VVPVLDAFQHRPSQPQLLPGDVRPPSDQHDHSDDDCGARRALGLIEQDADLNVVVFDSANPDFYLAHYDVRGKLDDSKALARLDEQLQQITERLPGR
jgi:hypothetical protein